MCFINLFVGFVLKTIKKHIQFLILVISRFPLIHAFLVIPTNYSVESSVSLEASIFDSREFFNSDGFVFIWVLELG